MNVSYRWLQSLAPSITLPPRELAERLALLGAPVDEVVELAAEIGDVVVARVDAVRPHPNADRLRVCTVDAGAGETHQVVCGAPNVEAGRFYPFAPIGATLPGGVQIKRAKLRGEESQGMLCSARELGLGRDHAGLMALAGEWTPGARFVDALGLDDARLLVDVTPNRPELLSHLGVAREAAPGGAADVRLPAFPGGREVALDLPRAGREGEADGVRITLEDAEGCPRFTAVVIRGVAVAPSPEWLATRLRAVGLRPINNVVDATNYVMMELGQPLHAYDLSTLRGPEIRVRRAAAGEVFRTLDGTDREMREGDLMIADGARSIGIAGVMGGENSEVGDATVDVLLECALFDPRAVRKTARRLGLSTDASYRFERGVDPEGHAAAQRRCVALILANAGGTVTGAVDVNPAPFVRRTVTLRPERVARLLGAELPAGRIAALLEGIGFGVEDAAASPLRVTVPGFRPDVEGEIDLIEEVARRQGFENLPEELLPYRPTTVPEDTAVEVERRLRTLFLRWGFLEARTMAFAPGAEGRHPILNPLSQEEGSLRDALVPGLLRRVEHNFAHGVRDVRLFTVGTVFFAGGAGEAPREELRVAAVLTGASRPTHWSGPTPPFDVWDLKALLEELAAEYPAGSVAPAGGALGSVNPQVTDAVTDAAAPPGAAGLTDAVTAPATRLRLLSGGAVVGDGGEAGEGAVDAPAWAAPVLVLEARLPARAADARDVRYAPLATHPASERDLALLVPDAVSAAAVGETIRGEAGRLLEAVFPFDRYAGKGIPEGTASVGWRLRFRAADRSLTDREVDGAVDRVLRALRERHGVERR
jgi:phenylalanyl-tRNA synthetase beta chain